MNVSLKAMKGANCRKNNVKNVLKLVKKNYLNYIKNCRNLPKILFEFVTVFEKKINI
jgi:hypothetical protein